MSKPEASPQRRQTRSTNHLASVEDRIRNATPLHSTEDWRAPRRDVELPTLPGTAYNISVGDMYDTHLDSLRKPKATTSQPAPDEATQSWVAMETLATRYTTDPQDRRRAPSSGRRHTIPGDGKPTARIGEDKARTITPAPPASQQPRPPRRARRTSLYQLDETDTARTTSALTRHITTYTMQSSSSAQIEPVPPVAPKPQEAPRRYLSMTEWYDYDFGSRYEVSSVPPPPAEPLRSPSPKQPVPSSYEWNLVLQGESAVQLRTRSPDPVVSPITVRDAVVPLPPLPPSKALGTPERRRDKSTTAVDVVYLAVHPTATTSTNPSRDHGESDSADECSSSVRSLHRAMSFETLAVCTSDLPTRQADPRQRVPMPDGANVSLKSQREQRLAEVEAAFTSRQRDLDARKRRAHTRPADGYIAFQPTVPPREPQPDIYDLSVPFYIPHTRFDFTTLHNWQLSDAPWVNSPRPAP